MRYIAAVKVSPDGRLEKFADYPSKEKAEAHIVLHGDSGSMVLDNVNSVPIPLIKVVNYEITEEKPQELVESEANQYKQLRQSEYPPVGDQLDALWKAHGGDTTEADALLVKIKGVKAKHPKPSK